MSLEPILEEINPIKNPPHYSCKWIILGRLTGHGNIHNPESNWLQRWVTYAFLHKIPIFMKDNLRPIWGPNLIQQYPKEKQ